MPEYIEREALINEITQMAIDYHKDDSIQRNIAAGVACEIRNEVLNMPAADVAEVRHGEWKQCFEDWRKQIDGDECSACGFQHYGTSITHYHYCPNCGARMDGDEE